MFRIIYLGASPTFGWRASSDMTYPKLLEQKIKRNYKQMRIQVINAGEIEYSSYRGLIFFRTLILKYTPNSITISYVINDVDRCRFFGKQGVTDRELPHLNPFIVSFENLLNKVRFYIS